MGQRIERQIANGFADIAARISRDTKWVFARHKHSGLVAASPTQAQGSSTA